MQHIEGIAYSDDYWLVECPQCGRSAEYEGYFDSSDIYKCRYCDEKFMVDRIVFENDNYIE